MAELTKKDIKDVFDEKLEPFAGAIQEDIKDLRDEVRGGFNLVGERLDKVEENTKYLRGRAGLIERRINEIKRVRQGGLSP